MTPEVLGLVGDETDLPKGWRVGRLDELAEFNPEQVGASYRFDRIVYLDISSVSNGTIERAAVLPLATAPSRAKRIARDGDTLLSTVRPGNRAFAFLRAPPDNLVCSTGFAVLRAKPKTTDPRFVYYLASSPPVIDYLASIAEEKTAYPSVNPEDIAECEVPIPPIAEQRAIASILGSLDDDILIRQGGESGGLKRLFKHLMKRLLSGEWSVDHAKEWLRTTRPTVQAYDDKIELNRRMNQTLEEIARALFKFWFVDFGPVRAKAEGRWKKGESLPGMPADMWDLWPSEFEDSDIGEIPKGWTLGTLGDLAAWVSERVDPNHTKDKERYIALDDMPPKSIALSTFRNGSEVNSSIVRFRAGDILFGAMRPYFHKVGLAQFEGITRSTTFVLRPRGAALRPFGLFHFASADVIEFATAASVGTTIPYVHWESLAPYPVAIPSEALLQHFELGAMPILELIARNGESSRALAETRDALLPKLLSGEIRVPFGDGR